MNLDDAYANGAYIAGADGFVAMWAARAQAFRDETGGQLGLRYGVGEREVYDLFHPQGPAKGLMVFVHGGYWQAFDGSYWSHLARGARDLGWAVAVPSYTLAPEARISEITMQIARATSDAATKVGGPIVLTGHSAGGHLAARMAMPGVLPEDVAARLQKVVAISPVADLRPLLQTSMKDELRLDAQEADAESPVLAAPLDVAVTAWVGGDERPAFLDQARWLAQAWNCGHVIAAGRHHFDVIAALEQAESALTREVVGAP
jgi:acetyl esterase/lipase